MLAVGLGVGAALAATPAAASPDNDSYGPIDPYGSISWPTDLGLGLPDPVAGTDAPGVDLAVSLFGISLLQEGSAHASSVLGLAIAEGADSNASAGGLFSLAIADGADSNAIAAGLLYKHGGLFNIALADGADSQAITQGVFNSALADGADSNAHTAGFFTSAYADGAGSHTHVLGLGSTAVAVGDNAEATVAPGGIILLPFKPIGSGSYAFGDDSSASVYGSFSLAAAFGNNTTAFAHGPFGVDIEPLFTWLGLSPGDAASDSLLDSPALSPGDAGDSLLDSPAPDDSWLADLLDGSWLGDLV